MKRRAMLRALCILSAAMLAAANAVPQVEKVQAAPAKKPARKAAPALVVQGVVKAAARAPRPGSVPYKDAIIALHLTGVKTVGAAKRRVPAQIVVFVWGMRNNKLTSAARFKPGQKLKLALQPWEKVEGKYGGYNRRELESDEAMALDTYWGEIRK